MKKSLTVHVIFGLLLLVTGCAKGVPSQNAPSKFTLDGDHALVIMKPWLGAMEQMSMVFYEVSAETENLDEPAAASKIFAMSEAERQALMEKPLFAMGWIASWNLTDQGGHVAAAVLPGRYAMLKGYLQQVVKDCGDNPLTQGPVRVKLPQTHSLAPVVFDVAAGDIIYIGRVNIFGTLTACGSSEVRWEIQPNPIDEETRQWVEAKYPGASERLQIPGHAISKMTMTVSSQK